MTDNKIEKIKELLKEAYDLYKTLFDSEKKEVEKYLEELENED